MGFDHIDRRFGVRLVSAEPSPEPPRQCRICDGTGRAFAGISSDSLPYIFVPRYERCWACNNPEGKPCP